MGHLSVGKSGQLAKEYAHFQHRHSSSVCILPIRFISLRHLHPLSNSCPFMVHLITISEDPTQHQLVIDKQILAGAKRVLSKATIKKEPISVSLLHTLVDRFFIF